MTLKKMGVALTTALLTSCGAATSFENAPPFKDFPVPPGKTGDVGVVKFLQQQDLDLTADQTEIPVDIVWSIDNSRSMGEESQIVQNNLNDFMNYIEKRRDLKVAVISQTAASKKNGYGYSVELSQKAKDHGHVQVDAYVGSYSPAAIAAAATCDASTTDVATDTICGAKAKSLGTIDYDLGGIHIAKGALSSFFRPDSRRYYVFVTDDNSGAYHPKLGFRDDPNKKGHLIDAPGYNENHFLEATRYGGEAPTVFGFIGRETSMCLKRNGEDHVGTVYENLAKLTGGGMFDLCPTSSKWTQNLEEIAKKIIAMSSDSFEVKSSRPIRVVGITVDGVELSKAQYTYANGRVRFVKGIIKNPEQKITVSYYDE